VSRGLALLLGVGAGILVGMQAPINSRLGRAVGGVQAASISFLVGTVALLLVLSLARGDAGGFGGFAHLARAPWWAFVGGLLGAIYVTVAIFAVRTLGASGLTAAVIGGQLAISVAIDRFGLLGVARQPVGLHRVAGLVLLAAGVALVVRK
jgi:bacterial/archaeal transporter family-2 protein